MPSTDPAYRYARPAGPDVVVCPVGVGSLAQAMVEHHRARGDGVPSLLGVEPETAAGSVVVLISTEGLTANPLPVPGDGGSR